MLRILFLFRLHSIRHSGPTGYSTAFYTRLLYWRLHSIAHDSTSAHYCCGISLSDTLLDYTLTAEMRLDSTYLATDTTGNSIGAQITCLGVRFYSIRYTVTLTFQHPLLEIQSYRTLLFSARVLRG